MARTMRCCAPVPLAQRGPPDGALALCYSLHCERGNRPGPERNPSARVCRWGFGLSSPQVLWADANTLVYLSGNSVIAHNIASRGESRSPRRSHPAMRRPH